MKSKLFLVLSCVLLTATAYAETFDACRTPSGRVYLIGAKEDGFNRQECKRRDTPFIFNENPTGNDRMELHLFDGDGQDLGIIVSRRVITQPSDSLTDTTTYVKEADVFVHVWQGRNNAAALNGVGNNTRFTGLNCTGTAFLDDAIPHRLYYDRETGSFLKPIPESLGARDSLSFRNKDTGSCINTSSTSFSNSSILEEVILPFAEKYPRDRELTPPLVVVPIE